MIIEYCIYYTTELDIPKLVSIIITDIKDYKKPIKLSNVAECYNDNVEYYVSKASDMSCNGYVQDYECGVIYDKLEKYIIQNRLLDSED